MKAHCTFFGEIAHRIYRVALSSQKTTVTTGMLLLGSLLWSNSYAAQVSYQGTVEAVRQSNVAAQVSGVILQLPVKAGDQVKKGQLLLRLDDQMASQNTAAAYAQVTAARAALDVVAKDLTRKKQLFAKDYISQAALDQAQAQYKSALAQVNALQASAQAAATQSGYSVIRAPFSGVVSAVNVELGDMAMPGQALLTLYDPSQLRVNASIPASILAQSYNLQPKIELLSQGGQQIQPTKVKILPTVNAQSATQQVWLDLPAMAAVHPGQFAKVWVEANSAALNNSNAAQSKIVYIPASAVFKRGEMTGVYMVNAQKKPVLRQVRIGQRRGDKIEILSGIDVGERVFIHPEAIKP